LTTDVTDEAHQQAVVSPTSDLRRGARLGEPGHASDEAGIAVHLGKLRLDGGPDERSERERPRGINLLFGAGSLCLADEARQFGARIILAWASLAPVSVAPAAAG
jgi:hypothetical protein